jgi:acetyl-CoA carboxylase carboxyl transferase subunit beta
MNPRKRLNNILDEDSFEELNDTISNDNPLAFEGYEDKIKKYESKTEEKSAVVTGIGQINNKTVAIGVMNPYFMMGSMGSVVGEKLTRLIEYATEQSLPLIIFTASGGARMQEGVYSLLQMAKTSAALKKHAEAKHLYISVLTDPTTGGVSASFAMLGDIIIAEPDALIGFAGPRVIKQTIKKELPEGFQKSEFLLATGFIDFICERSDLRDTLDRLLIMHGIDAND